MAQGELADRLKQAMGADVKESSAPNLGVYLQELQDIAHRVERVLNAVDALLDMPEEEARHAALNLLELACRQSRHLNRSLDSSALAKLGV